MVARGKIRCQIIAVPVSPEFAESRFSSRLDSLEPKPSELLPWSDPYISGLVNKLQREVREERQVEWNPTEVLADRDIRLYGRELADFELDAADVFAPPSAEAEWPWFNEDFEENGPEEERTHDWNDGPGDIPALV